MMQAKVIGIHLIHGHNHTHLPIHPVKGCLQGYGKLLDTDIRAIASDNKGVQIRMVLKPCFEQRLMEAIGGILLNQGVSPYLLDLIHYFRFTGTTDTMGWIGFKLW